MPATEKKAIRCVIRYFSKDTVLKNVLEAQCEGYKISNLIELAVSYHSMTGGYLNIGTVAYYDEYPEKRYIIYIFLFQQKHGSILRQDSQMALVLKNLLLMLSTRVLI